MLSILVNREGTIKGALVKKRKGYEIIKAEEIKEHIGKEEFNICVVFSDIVHEKIKIPKVKDIVVKDTLIKKKLREITGLPENFVYTCVKEKEEEKEVVCEIYAFREEIVKNFLKNPNLSVISIEPFSSSFYLKEEKDKVILSVFLLENENYLGFSLYKGEDILLIRTLTISSYVDNLNEYVLDNVMNFIVYSRARLNVDPDLILLNGDACENEVIPKKIVEEFQIPVATLLPPNEGVPYEVFKNLFPLFGLFNITERYNFLPLPLKKRKFFVNLIGRLNKGLAVTSFVLGVLTLVISYNVFSSLQDIKKEVNQTEILFKRKLEIDRNSTYYINYLSELLKSKARNPILVLPYLKDFLNFVKPISLEFSQQENNLVVKLYVSKKFKNLQEMMEFENNFNFYKNVLTKRGIRVRVVLFRKDLEKNEVNIRLVVEKPVEI